MRIHFCAVMYAFWLAHFYSFSREQLAILCLTCAGVMSAEAMNTAVERLTDKVSPHYHILAKIAKDGAAGAVLISAVCAAAVAFLLFGDIAVIRRVIAFAAQSPLTLVPLLLSVVLCVIFIGKREGKE